MSIARFLFPVCMAAAVFCGTQPAYSAAVSVGSSSLISTLDYSDTFTLTDNGGIADRLLNAYPLSLVDYPVNGTAGEGLAVENTYGNAARNWADAKFAMCKDGSTWSTTSIYPGASGKGSDTGITQTGGRTGDLVITYGLRNKFVVQFDAVQTQDRVGFTFGSLLVMVRPTGISTGNEIAVYNSSTGETSAGLTSGLLVGDINKWHNYAATVDVGAKTVEVFVDEASCGVINLNTLVGGVYASSLTNATVGISWSDGDGERFWSDNFQVGAVPEPGTLTLLAVSLLGCAFYFRKK